MAPTPFPPPIVAYLRKRGVNGPWQLNTVPKRFYSAAVVIPSLAEAANLPRTLESLSRNPRQLLADTAIIIVVNQRADATATEAADNRTTLENLPQWCDSYELENLFWIDAATPGRELPAGQGVGLARKIGMDTALTLLDYTVRNPLLICLDADTLVQADYLSAIFSHFAAAPAGGSSIPYCHQAAADPAGQAAIDRYELFLRVYVLGLELAGSPYAFHTVGSAMACRATAYCAAGGMNRRLAGEDFYFLQQLHKTAGVATLAGTVVYPSPRSSHRVPFGTGRSVGDMLAEGEQRLLFYQPVLFDMVGEWLATVAELVEGDASRLLERAGQISPVLSDYLQQAGFTEAWENMTRHNRTPEKLLVAFHSWFDAFRTMRLIHEWSERGYPRCAPETAVPSLLKRAGLTADDSVAGQLELLRRYQEGIQK